MGPKFRPAAAAVAKESAAFVTRLTGIQGYSFAEDVPFADNRTKEWLQEVTAGGGEVKPAVALGDPEEAKVSEAYEMAKELSKDKKLPEAADLLLAGFRKAPSGRLRLLWRIALMRLLVNAGRPGPALPHGDQILADIEAFRLAEFDPGLALAGFKAALSVLGAFKDDKSKERLAQVLNQIARLDPGEALRLDMR
jgi:type VI secretion system protein VasJ